MSRPGELIYGDLKQAVKAVGEYVRKGQMEDALRWADTAGDLADELSDALHDAVKAAGLPERRAPEKAPK